MAGFENGTAGTGDLKWRLAEVRECLARAKKLNDWLVAFRVDKVSLEGVSLHLGEVEGVGEGLDGVERVAMAALRRTEEVVDGGELKFYGVEENVGFCRFLTLLRKLIQIFNQSKLNSNKLQLKNVLKLNHNQYFA